jgi:hypothetical protein
LALGFKQSPLLCGAVGGFGCGLLFGGKLCSPLSGEASFFESGLMLSLKLGDKACSIFNEQLSLVRREKSPFA